MKIKLLILFLFTISVTVKAQVTEIYNITSIQNRNGIFYQITVIIESDSTKTTKEIKLGDTSEVINRFITGAIETTRQYAQVSVLAARKGIVQNSLDAAQDTLQKYIGISLRDTIRNSLVFVDSTGTPKHLFEGDDYQFFNGTQTAAAITRQPNGNLRFRPNIGQPTTYGIAVFGDRWIRINAYPSAGSFLDFYFDTDRGIFISDTRTAAGQPYRLVKASLAVRTQNQRQ